MKIGTVVRGACIALVIGAGAALPALGQGTSLERVEELVRMGRAEEARGLLVTWWERESDAASRRDLQRALWLRGRLTVDPAQAELDFQRLVVLYPRGQFTADAIFRMAQAAHEAGDEQAARAHVETLRREYASSPVRQRAESWLRAAGPAPAPPQDAPPSRTAEPSPQAEDGAADRPAATPPPARETGPAIESPAGTATGAMAGTPAAPPAAGAYFVQLGAFAEEERAMALFEEVSAQGIDVRIVRVDGSRFLHVRFGRFVERAAAARELERLAEAGINAALVRDERAEVLVRS